MTPEIYAALIVLLTAALSALTLFVRYIGIRLQAAIAAAKKAADDARYAAAKSTEAVAENTAITRDIHKATNGRLAAVVDKLQAVTLERDALRAFVNYVQSRPEGKDLLSGYTERRRVHIHDPALAELLALHIPEQDKHQ